MAGVLDGVRVVEVSMWAMVPAAGAVLAEWGADVVKIESPDGDPVRALVTAGITPDGPRYTWEMWNRGKRAMALDLRHPDAQRIVHQLVAEADVFLTSILPAQRSGLGIDVASIRAANPAIIYAAGTGQGSRGPDADKGGYDGITFWARSGAAAATTTPGTDPVTLPAGAFGDATSGLVLAGGVAAALAKKARTGEGSIVEGSLLATAMWAMQMSITGAAAAGLDEMPRTSRNRPFNVLVNSYPTADGRWVSLCMLQADRFWPGFCAAIGRDDLAADPRFADAKARAANAEACVAELDATFLAEPLAVWRDRLATQDGQWDVLNTVSEVLRDPQVQANQFVHRVRYDGGHELSIVGSPVQFDGTPPTLRPAPEFGADTDAVLESLGWDTDAILEAKIKGAVV
ncbi:CaiB/BaiF CoA transferase family protein [Pseudofrankia inefficax]|uniref:L-carnitine dehydratase/bile acid-inducible protein F n=1 Tax=Pseudofrankia inefficax (strain DSM 45817 / CECT 9037 / DDB 130130 / EuI1c) TaxID=298654 RepID=E3J7S3_PSEI1|nr:CoA transferase [Pseudofrankia inefficax]ADP80827.1 L-carnitine dehydratase/bile acid-inducible protein F [Pseudofrankia inefficax]